MLHLDADDVRANFGRYPFAVRHELADHELTTLDALAELADTLPEVEHHSGKVGDVVSGGHAPMEDLTPGEMVRSIETNDCWMVLPIHEAPAYAGLMDELFADVQAVLPASEGRIVQRQAVFFLATGGSTTPTHIDIEQGFLLHLRGEKEVTLGDFPDQVTAQRKIEGMHRGEHRNLDHTPYNPRKFDLRAGDGVHVPAFRPHVVHTAGGQVSLSLAVAMRTESTIRHSNVHTANGHLRRLGLTPLTPGMSGRADRAKDRFVSALAKKRG